MKNTSRLVLVPAVALVCLAGLSSPAAAAESRVEITSATSDTHNFQAKGKVASSDPSCKKGRKVSIYHDVDPAGPSENDFKIGTVKTNAKGKWNIASTALPDKIYAVLKKKGDCAGDTSPTEDVEFHEHEH